MAVVIVIEIWFKTPIKNYTGKLLGIIENGYWYTTLIFARISVISNI